MRFCADTLPRGLNAVPVPIVDGVMWVLDSTHTRAHVPEEVHFSLPHLQSQEINLRDKGGTQFFCNTHKDVIYRPISGFSSCFVIDASREASHFFNHPQKSTPFIGLSKKPKKKVLLDILKRQRHWLRFNSESECTLPW